MLFHSPFDPYSTVLTQTCIRRKQHFSVENYNSTLPTVILYYLGLFCMQDLSEEEYREWYMKYKEAELSLENREEKLAELVDLIESDLTLLGATGMVLKTFYFPVDRCT